MKRPTELIEMLDTFPEIKLNHGDAEKIYDWINYIESRIQPVDVNGVSTGGSGDTQPRKTVSDAVDYFDGVWPSDSFNCCYTTGNNWNGDKHLNGIYEFANSAGLKDDYAGLRIGEEGWVKVCTREEFEAEVERRKGEEWTHGIPPSNIYCYVNHGGEFVNCYLIGRDDVGAFVYRVDGQYYQTMSETNFKPIKPSISKVEVVDMMERTAFANWTVADFIKHIHDDFEVK